MQLSTAVLAVRAAIVVLVASGLMFCGVFLDWLAGTGPFGTLGFMAIGTTFGTIMLYVVISSSFPKSPPEARTRKEEAEDEGKPSD